MTRSERNETTIGAMRRRLALERPVAAPDGLGGATEGFEPVAAVWASIAWLSGGEFWRRGRPEQAATHCITIRWRSGIDAGHRLRDGARLFDVRAVADPDGGRRRLVLHCEEISP